MAGIFVVNMNGVSVSIAKTLIQLKNPSGSDHIVELVSAWCVQSNVDTPGSMQEIEICRLSTASTVSTFTPFKLHPGDSTSVCAGGTAATGTNASGEGTVTDVLYPDAFNILNGWLYKPVPEERIYIIPNTFLALRFPVAPSAALTVRAGMTFREIG